jgi:hypothetical protein
VQYRCRAAALGAPAAAAPAGDPAVQQLASPLRQQSSLRPGWSSSPAQPPLPRASCAAPPAWHPASAAVERGALSGPGCKRCPAAAPACTARRGREVGRCQGGGGIVTCCGTPLSFWLALLSKDHSSCGRGQAAGRRVMFTPAPSRYKQPQLGPSAAAPALAGVDVGSCAGGGRAAAAPLAARRQHGPAAHLHEQAGVLLEERGELDVDLLAGGLRAGPGVSRVATQVRRQGRRGGGGCSRWGCPAAR